MTAQGRRRQRLTIAEMMLLTAGAALGLWLFFDRMHGPDQQNDPNQWVVALVGFLGGLSVVGPPLLLWELRHRRRPWQAGKVLWFSQGMASWLLWPPVIYGRVRGASNPRPSVSGACYFYGTPLMAIYVTSALLAGGWLRGRRRRALRRSWREQFGLALALLWACIGFYILYLFYREDLG